MRGHSLIDVVRPAPAPTQAFADDEYDEARRLGVLPVEIDSTAPSQDCEGKNHPSGDYGHEGPAAWIVTAVCPSCSWFDVAFLCDGRVRWIIARNGDFTCTTCTATMHWSECWTLSPLGGAS